MMADIALIIGAGIVLYYLMKITAGLLSIGKRW